MSFSPSREEAIQGTASRDVNNDDHSLLWEYNPGGGLVIGGCTASGQAAFDFAVRYLKGIPVGNLVLTDRAAGFDFTATGLDWMVVVDESPSEGIGQRPRRSDYRFLLTVVDGRPDRYV